MDTGTGTIFQFQTSEAQKKIEELLGRKLIALGSLPDKDCEYCAGEGAVQSKTTLKWLPCRCVKAIW